MGQDTGRVAWVTHAALISSCNANVLCGGKWEECTREASGSERGGTDTRNSRPRRGGGYRPSEAGIGLSHGHAAPEAAISASREPLCEAAPEL